MQKGFVNYSSCRELAKRRCQYTPVFACVCVCVCIAEEGNLKTNTEAHTCIQARSLLCHLRRTFNFHLPTDCSKANKMKGTKKIQICDM